MIYLCAKYKNELSLVILHMTSQMRLPPMMDNIFCFCLFDASKKSKRIFVALSQWQKRRLFVCQLQHRLIYVQELTKNKNVYVWKDIAFGQEIFHSLKLHTFVVRYPYKPIWFWFSLKTKYDKYNDGKTTRLIKICCKVVY